MKRIKIRGKGQEKGSKGQRHIGTKGEDRGQRGKAKINKIEEIEKGKEDRDSKGLTSNIEHPTSNIE